MNNQRKQFSEPIAEPFELQEIIEKEIEDFDFGEKEEGSITGAIVYISFSYIDPQELAKHVAIEYSTKDGVNIIINNFSVGNNFKSGKHIKTLDALVSELEQIIT